MTNKSLGVPLIIIIIAIFAILLSPMGLISNSQRINSIIIRSNPTPHAITPQTTGGIAPAPSPYGWRLLTTDTDEGGVPDIKALYYKVENGLLYFKVEYYRNYTNSSADVDTGIFLDMDMNASTGLPVDIYPNANNTGVGAEYVIIIGVEAWYSSGAPAALWKYNGTFVFLGPADYYDVPDTGNVAIVGVYLHNLTDPGPEIAVVAGDVPSGWDWAPNSGHVIVSLSPMVVGGLINANYSSPRTSFALTLLALVALPAFILVFNEIRREKKH